MQVDNRGIKIGESVVRKAQPGHDVQLSIDIDAQKVAEDSLAQGMDGARRLIDPDSGSYYQATGGAVVVLDAHTGAVVALASAPTFDPNVIVTGGLPPDYLDPNGPLPLIDRALSPYAPGSTFKLFSAMATLKYGIRTADETYSTRVVSSSATTSTCATRARRGTAPSTSRGRSRSPATPSSTTPATSSGTSTATKAATT